MEATAIQSISPEPVAEAVVTPREKAEKLTKDYVLWSVGCGLIPLPLLDIAGILTTQVRLVAKMSEAYGIAYSEHRIKNIVTPLVTSVGLVPIGAGLISSVVKSIPVLGTAIGVASMPVVAGATTYAIGKVFINHFETGGTLLDFNSDKMKSYYAEMLKEGKQVAENLKEKEAAKAAKK